MLHKNIWRTVLNFILPAHCVNCGDGGSYLCENCADILPRPIDVSSDHVLSLFEYDDRRVKRLIWQLKYHGITALTDNLGNLLHEELISTLADWQSYHPGNIEPWLVVPIPLSPARLKSRGYNQSERLAQSLVANNKSLFELETRALQKIKDTPTQVSVRDRAKRLKNLRGAFAVAKPERVHQRRIILVDDVTTTGATMTEARRTLKESGARAVLGITVAHG